MYLGSHRPLTIIVMAGMMLVMFLGAKFWMDSLPDVVNEEISSAKVVSLDSTVMEHRDRFGTENRTNVGVAQLELKDGKTFRTTLFKPYPSIGETVSVKVTHFSDGTLSAAVVH